MAAQAGDGPALLLIGEAFARAAAEHAPLTDAAEALRA